MDSKAFFTKVRARPVKKRLRSRRLGFCRARLIAERVLAKVVLQENLNLYARRIILLERVRFVQPRGISDDSFLGYTVMNTKFEFIHGHTLSA
jgi:hypothetical protein